MFRSQRVLRWIVGLVAMFAFSANILEVLIPDVHDGDARSSVTFVSDSDHDRSPTTPRDAPVGLHHAQHVDHCAHGHVAALSAGVSIGCARASHEALPISGASALLSVALAPSFRPPIL
jgi:hypothetical protein